MTAPLDYSFFQKNFEAGLTQIAAVKIGSDLETPVSAYLKLCANAPYSFLLESVEGGTNLGRYSIIGFDPDLIWSLREGKVQLRNLENSSTKELDEPPLQSLRSLLKDCQIDVTADNLPPMAVSGLFGMMGYDCIRLIEDIPNTNPDPLSLDDAVLIRPRMLVIFDNVRFELFIAVPVFNHANNTERRAEQVFETVLDRISTTLNKLNAPLHLPANYTTTSNLGGDFQVRPNNSQNDYHKIVGKAIDYIHAGEIFQVVPSIRYEFDFDIAPFELYRSLRRLNPSPFLFYFHFESFHLVGSSPEILVRLRDGTVTIRPIAGTRKRGQTAEEDKKLAADLLADQKECAEHLMLLDLGRNDVGRIAQTGSVSVTDDFIIEYYSHVMHIVSNVEGTIKEDKDALDALFAGFPAGTVSGAPKIRAMEIIDELEPIQRKFYGGCVGYFSANGDMDTCIALRTALVKDGKVYAQAGGGVVADSDPEFEFQECNNKAQAIISAAKQALSYPDQG